MWPVLFETEYFSLPTYGALLALGVLAGCLLFLRLGQRCGIEPDSLLGVVLGALFAGWLGGKAVHLVTGSVSSWTDALRAAGSVHAGLVFGLLGFVVGAHRARLPLGKLLDAGVPAVALMQTVARLGCFCAGCCSGTWSAAPWAVEGAHPVQLYDAAVHAMIFLVFLRLHGQKNTTRLLLGLWALVEGLSRLALECWRAHPGQVWGSLSFGVVAGVSATAIGCALLWHGHRFGGVPTPEG